MWFWRLGMPLLALGLILCGSTDLSAQQVTVATPFHGISDSFFEHTGVNWAFNYKGLRGSFGRPNMAAAGFGNFDPNAGISGGFAVRGRGFNGHLNFNASQGFRQSFITEVPSVTLMNGYPGRISDSSSRPFVMGLIPVVGDAPMLGGFPSAGMPRPFNSPGYLPSPPRNDRVRQMLQQLAEQEQAEAEQRRPRVEPIPADSSSATARASRESDSSAADSSSAGRAVASVAEAQRLFRQEQAAREKKAEGYLRRGLAAEQDGRTRSAVAYYRIAQRDASEATKAKAQGRLDALKSSAER